MDNFTLIWTQLINRWTDSSETSQGSQGQGYAPLVLILIFFYSQSCWHTCLVTEPYFAF